MWTSPALRGTESRVYGGVGAGGAPHSIPTMCPVPRPAPWAPRLSTEFRPGRVAGTSSRSLPTQSSLLDYMGLHNEARSQHRFLYFLSIRDLFTLSTVSIPCTLTFYELALDPTWRTASRPLLATSPAPPALVTAFLSRTPMTVSTLLDSCG